VVLLGVLGGVVVSKNVQNSVSKILKNVSSGVMRTQVNVQKSIFKVLVLDSERVLLALADVLVLTVNKSVNKIQKCASNPVNTPPPTPKTASRMMSNIFYHVCNNLNLSLIHIHPPGNTGTFLTHRYFC